MPDNDEESTLLVLIIVVLILLGLHVDRVLKDLRTALASEYEAVTLYARVPPNDPSFLSKRQYGGKSIYEIVAEDEMEHIKILQRYVHPKELPKHVTYMPTRSGAVEAERDAIQMYNGILKEMWFPPLRRNIQMIYNDEVLHSMLFLSSSEEEAAQLIAQLEANN